MKHPLTDKVCDQITDELDKIERFFRVEDCMRAAADWQLEQCIAWLDGYESEGWAAGQMRDDLRPRRRTLESIPEEDNQ